MNILINIFDVNSFNFFYNWMHREYSKITRFFKIKFIFIMLVAYI